MFTSHKQISPPSLVLKLKISEVSQKWIPKAVELKRIPTHKKCKCKKFCSQTRLVGQIYSSDIIMHRGYSNNLVLSLLIGVEKAGKISTINLQRIMWPTSIFPQWYQYHSQERKLQDLLKLSTKGKTLDLSSTFLNKFLKAMHGNQFGEFVCGY